MKQQPKQLDIVRAWKDEDYRQSLSEEQREQAPANPAMFVELTLEELEEFIAPGIGTKPGG